MTGRVKTRLLVAGAVAIVAIGFLIWWRQPPGETMADILRQSGYLEVMPPSTNYGPGTINTIEVTSDNKIKVHPTCDIDAQMLSTLITVSPTTDSTLTQKLTKNYAILADLKNIISSEISDSRIKDIVIQFKDVKILSISDEQLHKIQEKIINGACEEVIEMHLRDPDVLVCQTRSVLAADVFVNITYKEHITASQQENITRNVTAQLKVETEAHSQGQRIGKQLFYGVRLGRRGIIPKTQDAQPVSCQGLPMSGTNLSQTRHRTTLATLLGSAQSDK